MNKFISFRFLSTMTLTLATVFLFTACGDDDDMPDPMTEPVDPLEQRQTEGFVINAQTPSGTLLVKYFSEMPSGDVDVSDGKDFQQFFPVDLFDGAIYNARPDGSAGFAKIMVNGNGEVIEDSFIPTVDETSFQIAIKDATTGVFHDRNAPTRLTIFNPENMSVTATIDMGAGFVPGGIPQRYQTFYFRDDEVFSPLRGNDGATYDSLIVHVANLRTGNYERTLTFNSGGLGAPFNDFGQHDLDEQGTLYIPDQGDVNGGNPASLHRILAGSTDFDPNYEFNIAQTLNPANVFLSMFRGFYYVANGQALALVATDTPQEAIDIVVGAGGTQNLTPDEIQMVLGILFAAENARWCTVDVEAQTVTPIPGIPPQSVFATTVITKHNGLFHLPVTTPNINALYSYDMNSGVVEKVFDLTGGGALVGVYNLSENH